jgi:cysteinyl-tRNA synthetase
VQQLVGTPTQGDPFALRLALLRFPYHVPATLTMARMRRADETLDRWRFKVANWKDMPAPRTGALVSPVAALLDGLDTASVLHLMHRVESDHTIASGAKFIAFVELDQVLGLDLQRYVGFIR